MLLNTVMGVGYMCQLVVATFGKNILEESTVIKWLIGCFLDREMLYIYGGFLFYLIGVFIAAFGCGSAGLHGLSPSRAPSPRAGPVRNPSTTLAPTIAGSVRNPSTTLAPTITLTPALPIPLRLLLTTSLTLTLALI